MVLCPATPSPRDFVATPFVPKGVKAEGCAPLFPFAPKGGAKRTRAARPRGWFFVTRRHPPATSSRPPSCGRGCESRGLRASLPLSRRRGVKAERCALLFPVRMRRGERSERARSGVARIKAQRAAIRECHGNESRILALLHPGYSCAGTKIKGRFFLLSPGRQFADYAVERNLPIGQVDGEGVVQLRRVEYRKRGTFCFGRVIGSADGMHHWRALDQSRALRAFENRARKAAPTGLAGSHEVIRAVGCGPPPAAVRSRFARVRTRSAPSGGRGCAPLRDGLCSDLRDQSRRRGRADLVVHHAQRVAFRAQAQHGTQEVLSARGIHPCGAKDQVARAAVAQCIFAREFGTTVHADGMGGIDLAIRARRAAIEYVIGGVMHHARAVLFRPGTQHAERVAIDALRELGFVLRAIDGGVGGGVDDDVRRDAVECFDQTIEIGEVDRFAWCAIFKTTAARCGDDFARRHASPRACGATPFQRKGVSLSSLFRRKGVGLSSLFRRKGVGLSSPFRRKGDRGGWL